MRILLWLPIVVSAIVGGFGSATLYPLFCRTVGAPKTGILSVIGVVSIGLAAAAFCFCLHFTARRWGLAAAMKRGLRDLYIALDVALEDTSNRYEFVTMYSYKLFCLLSWWSVAFFVGCGRDTSLSDHDLIQGTWRQVFLNDANRRITTPEEAKRIAITWQIDESTIVSEQPRRPATKTAYKIDPTHNPGWIDIDEAPGLYELDGNLLRIIIGRKRPSDFFPDLGTENLFVFELIEPTCDGARPRKNRDREVDPIGKAWKVIEFEDFEPQSIAWLGNSCLAVGGRTQQLIGAKRRQPATGAPAIILVDVTSGMKIQQLSVDKEHGDPSSYAVVASASDNKHLAVAHGDRVSLWSISRDVQMMRSERLEIGKSSPRTGMWPATMELLNLHFSPDGRQLVCGPIVWNVDSRTRVPELECLLHGGGAITLFGDLAATAEHHNRVHLWDAGSGNQLAEVHAMLGPLDSVAADPNHDLLAVGGVGGVKVWRVEDEGETWQLANERRLLGTGGSVTQVSFAPSGRWLASSSGYPTPTVAISDVATAKTLASLQQSRWPRWSPNGRLLATLTNSYATYEEPRVRKQIRLWETETLIAGLNEASETDSDRARELSDSRRKQGPLPSHDIPPP